MSTSPRPLSAAIAVQSGQPTLLIDGEPQLPLFYSLTDCPGGRWTWEDWPAFNIGLFAERGFTLFQVDLWFEHVFADADEAFDIDLVRRQIAGVLKACPRAAVVIRLHVNASRAFALAHPDACTEYSDIPVNREERFGLRRPLDDDEGNRLRVSLASMAWLAQAQERMRRFCTELAATPEGGRVIGIQPAGGVFGEWHYWGFGEHDPDVGPAMTAYFRRWLCERYGTDAALRAAWDAPEATLTGAAVPDSLTRAHIGDGIFYEPRTQRMVIDYFEAQQQVVADAILSLCRTAKESWGRPLITGAFYGYFFSTFGRQAAGGHLQMERVLTSPWIDYLSSPMNYQFQSREIGGSGCARGLLGPVTRHGKLWLDENDQNTSLHIGETYRTLTTTLDDDVAIIRRNVAHAATKGHGQWFYDFGPHVVSGWWAHPRLLEDIGKIRQIFAERVNRPVARNADVLVIYDTEVFYHTAHTWIGDCISHVANDELTRDLHHTGLVFDDALLFELDILDFSPYRLVIFANTFRLTEAQRERIHRTVMMGGRHVLFMYAPGYTDGQINDPDLVARTVGMDLAVMPPGDKPVLVLNHPDLPPSRLAVWNPSRLWVVRDPRASAYGYIGDPAEIGFARKDLGDATVWFASLPLADAAALRYIAEKAGAFPRCDLGDVVHVGRGVLCLHTATGGSKTVRLDDGRAFTIDVTPRSTTYLDAVTGDVLLR